MLFRSARTGTPVSGGAVSVSVFAPDCATADGLATVVSILGFDEGGKVVAQFPGTGLVVVEEAPDGTLAVRMTDAMKSRIDVRL